MQEFDAIEIGTFDKGSSPLRNREEFLNGGLTMMALQALVAFPQCFGDNTGRGFPWCLRNDRREAVRFRVRQARKIKWIAVD